MPMLLFPGAGPELHQPEDHRCLQEDAGDQWDAWASE